MAIRVFHADDHQTFRDGMRLILEREADIEVVGSAGDTGEAFKMIGKLKPDVALLDLSMPGEEYWRSCGDCAPSCPP